MNKWNFFTTNEISADGWLKRQLQIQAEGLSGNLDKIWKDIKDSAWIGGSAEGWERVPYWLDGFVPLAYLLEDKDMISRAQKYIDAIIARQAPDGWICPCEVSERETYDTWAIQLITKVLVVYYECSNDERIPKVVYDTLRNYYDLLSSGKIKLFNWSKLRWFETFIAINFSALYRSERYLCLSTAFCTNRIIHFSVFSVVLSAFFSAFRTSFWLIHKPFFCIKFLFSNGKNKFHTAVFTD